MLTDAEVLDTLEAIVAEKGEDYVYPLSEMKNGSCQYQTYDEATGDWVATGPSCLIGHLIIQAKLMDPEDLMMHEGAAAADLLVGYMSDKAVRACAEAQKAQDDWDTWGVALSEARTVLGYQV